MAGWRSSYDDWGNETEHTLLGLAGRVISGGNGRGKPTFDNDRCAGWRAAFDALGNETRRMFVDETGRPTRCRDKIAGYRARFDHLGNEIERTFLDEAEKPLPRGDGIASILQRYDARRSPAPIASRRLFPDGPPSTMIPSERGHS